MGLYSVIKMWNGKKKAITISSDDGVIQDKRFVDILNKYGLKATFNINSGMMYNECVWVCEGVEIRRMTAKECRKLFANHEIAAHSLTHPTLTALDDYMFERQIVGDKVNLETIFGRKITGFALPGGTSDKRLPDLCKRFGIKYVRGSCESKGFDVPENFYDISATVRYSNDEVFELIEDFINLNPASSKIMHIYGHSYEMDINNSWERFEAICRRISGRNDIFYGTNDEVYAPFFEGKEK